MTKPRPLTKKQIKNICDTYSKYGMKIAISPDTAPSVIDGTAHSILEEVAAAVDFMVAQPGNSFK